MWMLGSLEHSALASLVGSVALTGDIFLGELWRWVKTPKGTFSRYLFGGWSLSSIVVCSGCWITMVLLFIEQKASSLAAM